VFDSRNGNAQVSSNIRFQLQRANVAANSGRELAAPETTAGQPRFGPSTVRRPHDPVLGLAHHEN